MSEPRKKNINEMVVMIVDDDNEVRQIIKDYLILFGFNNFLEAHDGAEAYRFVLDTIQPIDLIISDWEMPRTDGLTLLKALRNNQNRHRTPFIMVTSQQSQERIKIKNAKKFAVDSYIIKPFRSEVLKEKIIQVLGLNDDFSQAA